MRDEIAPKNILMIGLTGVGGIEIARCLARSAQALFIKVEFAPCLRSATRRRSNR